MRATVQTPVLMSDQAFVGDPPSVANLDGHKLVVASSAAAAGGPAPGDRIGGIGLRQRILSEAALRMLEPGRDPLVVVLPNGLTSEDAADFFAGLDVRWLDLTSLTRAAARDGRTIEPDEIDYPARQDEFELDPETFQAADDLIADGDALQNLLTLNDRVGAELTEEALTGASYTARQSQLDSRAGLNQSRDWVQDKLRSVRDRSAARRDPVQRQRRVRRDHHQPARRAGDRLGGRAVRRRHRDHATRAGRARRQEPDVRAARGAHLRGRRCTTSPCS